MVALEDYAGREQAYVKHVFLERYLEALIFKTASIYNHIVYVDGFAGPWQSASEQFEDTSFGIALRALRRAKETRKNAGHDVRMTALLVEQKPAAYKRLVRVPERFPDIEIKTYPKDFISIVPEIVNDIPSNAFAFFFIDPKGWGIPLLKLKPMLERPKSEMTFNFMFEFINRAASMDDPLTVAGLNELMPYGDWRSRLTEAKSAEERKEILIEAFRFNLMEIGKYRYVVPTEILRPLRNRTLYSLFYATRHESGLAAFRECQTKALDAQAKTRAALKVQQESDSTGQSELFTSLHNMGPNETAKLRAKAKADAETMILATTPQAPDYIFYKKLWPPVLLQHAVRLTDVNAICGGLRKKRQLECENWEEKARVPKGHYKMCRP